VTPAPDYAARNSPSCTRVTGLRIGAGCGAQSLDPAKCRSESPLLRSGPLSPNQPVTTTPNSYLYVVFRLFYHNRAAANRSRSLNELRHGYGS
jgi:hypothetical protein